MRNYTVAFNREAQSFVVKDAFGFVIRKPGNEDKALSEQIPLYFKTEAAALAAAAKFQQAEEARLEQEADATSQHTKDRLQRMGAEGDRLRQVAEERRNLAAASAKVRELNSSVVNTERLVRDLESTISSLEGQLEVSRIDLSAARRKLTALKETLAKAKGDAK